MTKEEKTQGIEMLKKLFKAGYDTTDEVIKDLKDGNLSFTEMFGLSDNLFSVIGILTKIPELKAEIEDVSTDEIKELYEYIVGFGFVPEDVTEILRHIIAITEKEVAIYKEHVLPVIEIIKLLRDAKK
jgi:hypothetical protein